MLRSPKSNKGNLEMSIVERLYYPLNELVLPTHRTVSCCAGDINNLGKQINLASARAISDMTQILH